MKNSARLLQPRPMWMLIGFIGLGLLSLGCQTFASTYEYKGVSLESSEPLPDFELRSATGETFRLSDVEGDLVLIYFGYTSCPDVCPLTMWEVKKALADLETGQDQVHVIFITADPKRDTPEILSRYMTAFGPEFIGLTDDFEKIEAVMKPFGAFAEKEIVADSSLGYLVSHTATLFLVDPHRRLFLQYPFGFKAEELTQDLNHILHQENF